MTQTIEAVYQNGMFRPISAISPELADGETVSLTVTERRLSPDEMLALAGEVYDGLSDEEINDIEQIALDRSRFFDERP